MTDFNSLFPNFLNDCVQLKTVLTPVAYVLLVGGMIAGTISDHRSAQAMMRIFGRTIVFTMLLTFLVVWGNELSTIVDDLVKNQLGVDPANVFNEYKATLLPKKSDNPSQPGMLEWLFNWQGSFFEMLIAGILWCFGMVAGLIVFLAYIVQHFILYLGYSLAPIFIGFLAFNSLRRIGFNYLLNLVGVIIWPLGWGLAAIVTQGLIDFMTDQSFLTGGFGVDIPGVKEGAYGLQNLIGVTLLGIWLIFSTIAAPVIIQKILMSGAAAGAEFLTGARSATVNAAKAGATTTAAIASGGGVGAAVAGAVVGSAAAASTFVSSSSGDYSGSMLTTLAQMRPTKLGGTGGKNSGKSESAPFDSDDLTGEKAVKAMLAKRHNPYDPQS